jgi:hypothetical protein
MRLIILMICAILAAFAGSSPAHAAIHVTLTDGVDIDTFSYNFGSFVDPTNGSLEGSDGVSLDKDTSASALSPDTRITFSGQVGDFLVEFTIRTNFPGTIEKALITETTITTRNAGTADGSITYRVEVDDFTLPGTLGSQMRLSNSISTTWLTEDGSASIVSGIGADPDSSGPLLFGQQTAPSTIEGPTLAGAGTPTFLTFIRDNTFDMGNEMTINLPGGGEATVTGTTVAVLPEASSIFAWTIMLALAGFVPVIRRRK